MGRCLLGVLFVTAGLVALTSVTRETRSSVREIASIGGTSLRETKTVTVSGTPRTLLRPAAAFGLRFSLN